MTMPSDGLLVPDQLVADTLVNQNAWNVDRWPANVSPLMGYPGGFPVNVTYFWRSQAPSNIRSNPVDHSLGIEHVVHTDLIQINTFELRMDAGFEMNPDDEERRFEVRCQFVPPIGFTPYVGDMFYYQLQDGKIGLMVLDEVSQLTLSQASFRKCTASLVTFMTAEQQAYIQQMVVDVRYFDKARYLSGGMTLLTSKSYVLLNDCQQLRVEMIKRFGDTYWDELMGTFMRPDGIYDPYLVDYWNKKVSLQDWFKRPAQLIPTLRDYPKSIWSAFTDKTRSNAPSRCYGRSCTETRHCNFWTPGINPLINRDYLVLIPPATQVPVLQDAEDYVFSTAFYQENTAQMTTEEQMVYECMRTNSAPDQYVTYAKNYRNWSDQEAFYKLPIAIWLMDQVYFNVH